MARKAIEVIGRSLSVAGIAFGFFITSASAQTGSQALVNEFYQLISGKWTRISNNAGTSIVEEQVNLAAAQCYSVKKLDAAAASKVSSISKSVAQKLSRLIIYQKLETGLRRIDFGNRVAINFPALKIGKIASSRDSFELSNDKLKIRISFARLKQNNNYVPVMIEGKAMYLKCP